MVELCPVFDALSESTPRYWSLSPFDRRWGRAWRSGSWVRRLLVSLILAPLAASTAQDSPCDPSLLPLARGPEGYQLRGERCEGTYVQPVGGTALWLVSLTQSFEAYDPTSGADLLVSWSTPGKQPVRLRAQGIQRGLYYRMDAIRPADSAPFHWPSDVLLVRHIAREQIGATGWTRMPVAGVEELVYLPLRVAQRASIPPGGPTQLTIYPTVELTEVYLSVASGEIDGRTLRTLRQGVPLGHGYYPADQPVTLALEGLTTPGLYYVEVSATLAGGGQAVLPPLWIYHASR
jgi:hypothetical protein